MEKKFKTVIKVRYKETDKMGVVHHTNYFVYCEQARTEFLAHLGFPYSQMEKDDFYLPVLACGAEYHRPAYFEDEISVLTAIVDLSPVKVRFRYEIFKGDELITTAYTLHACLDSRLKPRRIPAPVMDVMKKNAFREENTKAS